jgi:hypothetical protein
MSNPMRTNVDTALSMLSDGWKGEGPRVQYWRAA